MSNEPDLTLDNTHNFLSTTGHGNVQNGGPNPAYLWYVSEDGQPFRLVSVAAQTSYAVDDGQHPGSRGGWPDNLPAGNPDISKPEDLFSIITQKSASGFVISDSIETAIDNQVLSHDDTDAIQHAINDAESVGGGIVQLGAGTFNIGRPMFHGSDGQHYKDMHNYFWWAGSGYLYLADNAVGHISIQGVGVQSVINTPPDHNSSMFLMDLGSPMPGFSPDNPISINEVAKGSTNVVLTDGASTSSPQVGDDIELYTGSFSDKCTLANGEPGGCHFSELNTVTARHGNILTLTYPTTKRYYDDGRSSFGLTVRTHLPSVVVPHLVAFQHMTINTYNALTTTGNVIGMLVNDVQVNGYVSHGLLTGGAKRDVTVQNSSWGFGAGDASWSATAELDKCTNFVFLHNVVKGYAALHAEGLSLGARIYATEGASQILYKDNTFTNVSAFFQHTTDVAVVNNTFQNGTINMGSAYGDTTYNWGPFHDSAYESFGSQENGLVAGNTMASDTDFTPPAFITFGHYKNGSVTNNTIVYRGSRDIPVVISYGGTVADNSITVEQSGWSTAIAVIPDLSPNTPDEAFAITRNTILGKHMSAAVYVVDPGLHTTAPMCIENNTYSITGGQIFADFAGPSVNLSCAAFN